jgi:hypothetical protein
MRMTKIMERRLSDVVVMMLESSDDLHFIGMLVMA